MLGFHLDAQDLAGGVDNQVPDLEIFLIERAAVDPSSGSSSSRTACS